VTVPDDDVRPVSDGTAEAEASAASETADAAGQSPAAPSPAETPPADPPAAETPPAETPPTDPPPRDPPPADQAPADAPPGMGVTPVPGTGDECHTHTGRAGGQDGQAADAGAESGPEPAADPLDADPSAAETPLDGATQPGEPQPGEAQPGETQPGEAQAGEPPPAALAESQIAAVLAGLTSVDARMGELATASTELARLRTRDTDLIARLHDDVTRLRTGEIAAALHPVVIGMIKLHDQMVSLGALSDPASPVGMLHTQLLQTMELTCGVKSFTPAVGEQFDPVRHSGIRRIPTTDESADGTIAGTVKAGFARPDGSVVRVAEVEVHRLQG
jgi:molecular chaperone GrpE (heat shock protein)